MAAETDAVFRSYDPIKPCMNRTVQERTDKDTLSKHQFAVSSFLDGRIRSK